MKKKIAFLALISMLFAAASAYAEVSVENGISDRDFDENRTLYYVNISSDEIPNINADGYTVLQKATKPFEGNALTEENTTVIKNNETGKKYRFVFQKIAGDFEMGDVILSADGTVKAEGIAKDGIVPMMFILKPTASFSQNSFTYDDVDESEMEKTVLDVVKADKDGESLFAYEFPKDAPSGQYGFLIVADSCKTEYFTSKFYISQEDIKNTIKDINEKTKFDDENTPEKLAEYIESNSNALFINMEKYDELSKNAKLVVVRSLKSDKEYESIDEIGNAFYKGVSIAWIYDGKAPSEILSKYKDNIKLEMTDNYFSLENKADVDKKISGIDNEEKLREEFNKAVSISMINEAEPAHIKEIIEKYNMYLKLDESAYSYFVSNASKCVKALGNKNFKTTDEISKAILNVKNSSQAPEYTGGSSSSSGKGSGGNNKGAASSYVAPISQKPTADIIPEQNGNTSNINLPFEDIKDVAWAHKAIEYLYNNKVLNGKSENTFAPKDNVKREEFVKLVVNAFNLDGEGTVDFEDVNKDAWYYDHLVAAVAKGVVNGISEREFGTGRYITRQDMAVMIYRAVSASDFNADIIVENISELSDIDTVSDYAREAVDFMIQKGAINGIDGEFRPFEYATRAQTAQMLYQIVKIR